MRYFLPLLFLLVPFVSFADPNLTVSPSSPASNATTLTVTYAGGPVFGYSEYRPDGSVCNWNTGSSPETFSNAANCGTSPDGAYHFIYIIYSVATGPGTPCAGSSTYAGCIASGAYAGEDVCVDQGSTGGCAAPPAPSSATSTSAVLNTETPESIAFAILAAMGIYFVVRVASSPWRSKRAERGRVYQRVTSRR